jgi:23S rRNA (guanosine2251-2'-O)-methyltransferase
MNDITFIYGKHAVREVCALYPSAVRTVYAVDDGFRAELKRAGISSESLDSKRLPGDVPKDAVHQGCVAAIDPTKLMRTYAAFAGSLSVSPDTALVLLGEVQDPHNVGAIIRSAAAFGLAGVLIPEHRQAQITGAVIKASAGMAFRIPLVSIGNVNTTIRDLKERGFWIYGLDGDAAQSVGTEGFEKPSVFILGNEGSGIREKTLEHCDIPLQIQIASGVESLNASVAAAVVCYAWSLKHPQALAAKQ